MLATITLATTEEPWGTWLGSTAGMVAADAIAIALGAFLGHAPAGAGDQGRGRRWRSCVFGVLLIAEGLGWQ